MEKSKEMIEVTNFLESMLYENVMLEELEISNLPLYLMKAYDYYNICYNNYNFIIIIPKKDINLNLVTIRKLQKQIKRITQTECVVVLKQVNDYCKNKLIEEKIPFILNDKQVFLPFLGVVLSNRRQRITIDVVEISYSTQKMLLSAIYRKWSKKTLTEVAKELHISKMSVTRIFDEIEGLDIGLIKHIGKYRYFLWEKSSFDLWLLVKPFFRNPVTKEYRFDAKLNDIYDGELLKLSGISALAHYTMLNDEKTKTYAISTNQLDKLDLKKIIPNNEYAQTIVQVHKYIIDYSEDYIDPLSMILSIKENEYEERVEIEIDNLLDNLFT